MDNASIKLKVFIQPSWCKSHKEVDLILPQGTLGEVKKRILTAIKAPSRNIELFEFNLQYLGLEAPLVHEDDFYMMLMDLLQDKEKLIVMNVKKIVKRRAKKQFAFDEVGTVNPTLENEGDIELNRPSDKIYNGAQEVSCIFCRVSNKDKAAIKDLGPFYGPFKNKQKIFHTHELCAIWTPEVFLDKKTSKLRNLLKEVKRCNKMNCSYCGKFGGGLGCKERTCRKTYHFRCVLDDKLDCQLDYNNHTIYCPDHAEKDDDIDVENIFCRVCDGGEDEAKMIICEKCLNGYHIYCLEPALSKIPEEDWYCDSCSKNDDPMNAEDGSQAI